MGWTFEYCFSGISYSKLTTEGMRNVLRLRAAVKAVEETLLDAEPVVTTVAQVAAPAPVAAPAETTPAPGGSACKGEEGMKSEENGLGKAEGVVLHHDT